MALDLTPEQKEIGKTNFQRVVGHLAEAPAGAGKGVNRRQFMKGLIAAGAVVPVSAAVYFGYSNDKFREKPVKAGLIGAGDEGGVLVGEHNPKYLQFIAYSDIRPSNQKRIFEDERDKNPNSPRKGFKFHYGSKAKDSIKPYEKYQDLLANPEIEAVVIALPLHLHSQVAIAALKAGKHVLCEKLMAWNVRQCKEMLRAQDEMLDQGKDLLLAIGHQRHYSLLYAQAVETIRSGILGDVHHIRALWHRNNARLKPELIDPNAPYDSKTGKIRYKTDERSGEVVYQRDPDTGKLIYADSWRPAIKPEDSRALKRRLREFGYENMEQLVRWRLYLKTGGGLMAELGSHQLDACSIFLGKVRPLAVSGVGGKYFYQDDREVEDHVFCTFEFPGKTYERNKNDRVVVTYSSISTNQFEPYGECVMGTQGTMVVEGEQQVMLWGAPGRATAVTVKNAAAGKPALEASGSTDPVERKAADTGKNSVGPGPVSRGYREEMEHFAYCIRMRQQGYEKDKANLKPRCDGHAAMADAIMALTANVAMRGDKASGFKPQRIEFRKEWYDHTKLDAVPDKGMKPFKLES
jgi:predicted dehydrogenase